MIQTDMTSPRNQLLKVTAISCAFIGGSDRYTIPGTPISAEMNVFRITAKKTIRMVLLVLLPRGSLRKRAGTTASILAAKAKKTTRGRVVDNPQGSIM
jgi:hypothetical protein